MNTETKDLKISKQNRILLNLVWGFSLVILGEGYVFSPAPGLLSQHVVDASSGLFWLVFWAIPVAFLCLQAILHLKVLNRYFPEQRRRNRRSMIGTPLAAFLALVAILALILPMSVVHA